METMRDRTVTRMETVRVRAVTRMKTRALMRAKAKYKYVGLRSSTCILSAMS
jgi:hypothetical protein